MTLQKQRLHETYFLLPLVEGPCDSCALLAGKQGHSFLGDSIQHHSLSP